MNHIRSRRGTSSTIEIRFSKTRGPPSNNKNSQDKLQVPNTSFTTVIARVCTTYAVAWRPVARATFVKLIKFFAALNNTCSAIVELYDVISINENTFATVLEYCGGETLGDHQRTRPDNRFSEKEARGVILQLMCGLKAMNRREEPIIHYDLKPSNLIFDRGTTSRELVCSCEKIRGILLLEVLSSSVGAVLSTTGRRS